MFVKYSVLSKLIILINELLPIRTVSLLVCSVSLYLLLYCVYRLKLSKFHLVQFAKVCNDVENSLERIVHQIINVLDIWALEMRFYGVFASQVSNNVLNFFNDTKWTQNIDDISSSIFTNIISSLFLT